jgi:DnaK suppressor protein
MPSKKPNQSAKKPGKALPKKATPKAAAPKKVAHPTTKPKLHPKPVLTKVAVKSTKPVSKPTAAKPAVKAPSRAKSPPNGELVPKPDAAEAPEKSAPIKFDIRPMVLPRAAPLNEEDGEFEPPTTASLLAGPRNVKPYIARRGEQYMNKEQLEHFARILQNWKRDLMVEVDRTVLHMKDEAANFPDPNDRATQEEEFSLELRTRDRERKLIRKIDEALKRIEDGSYGYCLETGEEIGIKRLEARPVATLSVEAQERRERREKQYGDRDDRYR